MVQNAPWIKTSWGNDITVFLYDIVKKRVWPATKKIDGYHPNTFQVYFPMLFNQVLTQNWSPKGFFQCCFRVAYFSENVTCSSMFLLCVCFIDSDIYVFSKRLNVAIRSGLCSVNSMPARRRKDVACKNGHNQMTWHQSNQRTKTKQATAAKQTQTNVKWRGQAQWKYQNLY